MPRNRRPRSRSVSPKTRPVEGLDFNKLGVLPLDSPFDDEDGDDCIDLEEIPPTSSHSRPGSPSGSPTSSSSVDHIEYLDQSGPLSGPTSVQPNSPTAQHLELLDVDEASSSKAAPAASSIPNFSRKLSPPSTPNLSSSLIDSQQVSYSTPDTPEGLYSASDASPDTDVPSWENITFSLFAGFEEAVSRLQREEWRLSRIDDEGVGHGDVAEKQAEDRDVGQEGGQEEDRGQGQMSATPVYGRLRGGDESVPRQDGLACMDECAVM